MYDNPKLLIYDMYVARVTHGPHASCHVASAPRRNGAVDPRATWLHSPRQPRLGPVATSAPLATSAAGNISPFSRFSLKKILKNPIKIQIKIGKIRINFRNSYFSKYNSFLIQIFSIGSQILSFLILCHLKYVFKKEIRMN